MSVTCIAFRAAEDKHAGDVSRNWGRIEDLVPRELTRGVTLDPHDSAVYLIGLEDDVDGETVDDILNGLAALTDARDNRVLLSEPARRAMMPECFEAGNYCESANAAASFCTA